MKRRLFAMILALCLVLALAGCSSAEDVEAAIREIGTVTLESGNDIEIAELMYDSLSASAKDKVSNAQVLWDAIDEFDRLNAAVDKAVDAINDIGFVDLDSWDDIDHARKAYDALIADNLTGYVTEYAAVLIQSEDSFGTMYTEDAYATAKEFYQWGDYRSADATLRDAVTRFPNAELTPKCKELGVNSVAELANTHYISGDLESAMTYLLHGEEIYGTNGRYDEVRNSVEVALAVRRPANGTVFSNSVGSDYCKFTVFASDSDACVKLVLKDNPKNYVMFYVRSGENATVYVPGGTYLVKYVTGPYWFNEVSMFGEWGTYAQADGDFTLNIRRDGGYVYYDAITLTLYSVVDGDVGVMELPSGDF